MKRQTPPKSPKDFVALLNELDDAVPMGDEEAAEILREAGIDSSRELKRAMVLVEEEEKRQQKALFERAGIERRAVLNQPRCWSNRLNVQWRDVPLRGDRDE